MKPASLAALALLVLAGAALAGCVTTGPSESALNNSTNDTFKNTTPQTENHSSIVGPSIPTTGS